MTIRTIDQTGGDAYVAPERPDCSACSGSRYYDALDENGKPILCGACDGTGKERGAETEDDDLVDSGDVESTAP